MRIGVPAEVKVQEHRVATTPAGVRELTSRGHEVLVERDAGRGSSFSDDDYAVAGAQIAGSPEQVWEASDLILKVKEPIDHEYPLLRRGQILFTYLHLAASRRCTEALLNAGAIGIAYETVQLDDGSLPLLAPMSETAGRMAPQVGARSLERSSGGRGTLLGGVTGVEAAKVVVLGGGVSGLNAATIALGMQAQVRVLDRDLSRLREIDLVFQGSLQTIASNATAVDEACRDADLVIGAVLIAGAQAPKLVSTELVRSMKPGSVLVDIAIDQGGCFEGSRPTTHDDPTFEVHDSLYYCVANMPGAVPHTSTQALANVTLPYALAIAERGWRDAAQADPALARGLSTVDGRLVSGPVGDAHGLATTNLDEVLS